ncbi:MAG: hypothetical protein WBD95_06855, partial [Xanthobacteraceae bacterium]
ADFSAQARREVPYSCQPGKPQRKALRANRSPPRSIRTDPDPFPIPWLDKNGSHNQPAGPDLEPSHIYHFKGRVARCSGFDGAGTDGKRERILFGTKTTDFGIMDGEYWAARAQQSGTFTHI